MQASFLTFQKCTIITGIIAIALITLQCGEVKLAKNRSPTEAAPTGTLVSQGSFTAESGSGLTGIAQVYLSSDNTQYVIRIQGLSAPSETGLQLTGMANGASAYQTELRTTTGDTNYETGVAPTVSWNTVTIRSPTKNKNYGTALLTAQ